MSTRLAKPLLFALAQPALSAAAYMGQEATVRQLLAHSADAGRLNHQHQSALTLAQSEGHKAVVRLLGLKRRTLPTFGTPA